MDIYSQEIIRELRKKEFNTTDVVSTIIQRKEWQKEYIKLSEQYGSYNKLNSQIGRYLLNNQKKLEICKNGGKEESIAITKRLSSNQKWRLLFIPLLLFVSISAYAQILSPQKNSKSKWGYVNEIGKTVIKYKYDEARVFSEELAAVAREGKWGYIDKQGKLIIPLIYDGVGDFSEGLAKVKNNRKWGFIDKIGKEIVPMKYDEISLFFKGMAKVKSGKYLGFIDKTGKEIIPVKYDEIVVLSEEWLAKVRSGNVWGLIDKTGKEIIPVKYNEIGEFSKEGITKVNKGRYWGFINKIGIEIFPVIYDHIGDFSEEGLAKVASNGRSGFINKNATLVIPVKYESATDFSNGYAAVMEYKQGFSVWGIIDKTGKEILPATYKKEAALNMLSDIKLLQKEIQGKHAEASRSETLIEEVEAVLDNDFYSNDCPPVEVLKELLDELDKLEKGLPMDLNNLAKKSHLSELKGALRDAISAQTMTKKYGEATTKKIVAGKYEIGMTTEMVKNALKNQRLSNNQSIDMTPFYKKSESASSETWSIDWSLIRAYGLNSQSLKLAGADYPMLVFRNGKLTDIIR